MIIFALPYFLGPIGFRFLETIFPRTTRAAVLRSTSEAACIVHDRSLGCMGNYHLFRLPPALEDRLQQAIEKLDWSEATKLIESPDTAWRLENHGSKDHSGERYR